MKQFLRSLCTLLLLMMWCSVGFAQETLTGSWDLTKESTDWTATGNELYFSQPYGYKKANGTLVNKSIADFSTAGITQIKVGFKCQQTGSKGSSKITIYLVDAKGNALGTGTEVTPKTVKSSTNTSYQYATFTSNLEKATGFMMKVTTFEKRILINGASYEVTYNASTKTKTTLTFPKTAISINGGDEASFKGQSAKLYAGKQELTDKTIEYAHTGDAIFATFDGTTGAATLKSGVYGTATVTATYAGDDTYEKAEASYTVKIVDPNASEATFNFSKPDVYGYEVPAKGSATNLEEGEKMQSSIITITNIQSGKSDTNTNKARFHNKSGNITFRVYANGTISLSAQTGYTITKFAFKAAQGGDLTVSTGTYDSATKTWEGNAQSITLTIPNGKDATWFQTMTVTYSKVATTTPLTLEEDANDTNTKIEVNKGKTVDVALTRTLVANKWNTFCVPFDTELAGTALEGATVKAVGEVVGNVINLVDADKIEAGVPYLVMPNTGDIVNPTFKSVTISVTTPVGKGNDEYKFVGTYSPKPISDQEFGKIWGVTADGKLAKINADTTMKGLRAYFVFPTTTAAAKLNFDGETTGINNIETEATVNGKVYNLNGQYVGNSLNGLKKGIYVVNGKKVIK